MAIYYKYDNPHQGVRYFKVKETYGDVLQIITESVPKKGRPYMKGITFIKYSTWIGSWGWKLKESKNIVEIKRKEFQTVLKEMLKQF